MTPPSLERTLQLLERHGLEPRRALGQNFVIDERVIDRIIELAAIGAESQVLEIGPGLGALTAALARSAGAVVAVEKDESLLSLLETTLGADGPALSGTGSRVDLVAGDALTVDWSTLLDPGQEWVLVANLPYNVAVPIIIGVLERAPMVTRGVVMLQQEVAERLAAAPGGRTIGVPTIELGWYATARVRDTIPPEAFHPVPNVSSALLEFRRHEALSERVGVADVMALVAAAYRKRRKMLRVSLQGLVEGGTFERAGIDPTARPETLGVGDWVRLAEAHRDPSVTTPVRPTVRSARDERRY